MRSRKAVPLLLCVGLLVACGSSDVAGSSTTTTATTPRSTTSAVPEPVSTPRILAKLVVQVDDGMRRLEQQASACLHGPTASCEGQSLIAYQRIDEVANALSFVLRSAVDPANSMYSGRLADEVVGLFDESLNLGAQVQEKSKAAQAACLPDFPSACKGVNEELDKALIELQKNFNTWRDHL